MTASSSTPTARTPTSSTRFVDEGKISDETESKLKSMLDEYKGIFLADRGDAAPVARLVGLERVGAS